MILTDEEIAMLLHHPYFEKMWTEIESHIRKLELRIIELEKCVGTEKTPLPDDSYYWEHG